MSTTMHTEHAGHHAPPAGEKVTIPVSGMTCAACSGRVQRALEKHPGVNAAAVNLMLKEATVEFDPAATSPDALVQAIRSTGYDAALPVPDQSAFAEQEAQDRAHDEEFRDLRLKAGAGFAVAFLAMLFSMPLMAAGEHGHGATVDPFMRWAMGWLNPTLESAMPWLYQLPRAVISRVPTWSSGSSVTPAASTAGSPS